MKCLRSSLSALALGGWYSCSWHKRHHFWCGQDPSDQISQGFGAPVTWRGVLPAAWGAARNLEAVSGVLQCKTAAARRCEEIKVK